MCGPSENLDWNVPQRAVRVRGRCDVLYPKGARPPGRRLLVTTAGFLADAEIRAAHAALAYTLNVASVPVGVTVLSAPVGSVRIDVDDDLLDEALSRLAAAAHAAMAARFGPTAAMTAGPGADAAGAPAPATRVTASRGHARPLRGSAGGALNHPNLSQFSHAWLEKCNEFGGVGGGGCHDPLGDRWSGMEATSLQFAAAARALGDAARARDLLVPGFRSPPRRADAERTLKRWPGGATVSVRLRGRPFVAVAADMVEGVLVANGLAGDPGHDGSAPCSGMRLPTRPGRRWGRPPEAATAGLGGGRCAPRPGTGRPPCTVWWARIDGSTSKACWARASSAYTTGAVDSLRSSSDERAGLLDGHERVVGAVEDEERRGIGPHLAHRATPAPTVRVVGERRLEHAAGQEVAPGRPGRCRRGW